MTRVVGTANRSEFTLDPVKALQRGQRLDAMLAAARPPHPRGVFRAKHREFNAIDDARELAVARRLNEQRLRA